MNPVRRIPKFLTLVLLALAALASGTHGIEARGQAPPPTFEELVARVELLRSRQEVLTSEAGDFKADVAEATAALRAERASGDASVRAKLAAEDNVVRAEMAEATAALMTEMHALNSLAAADGSPAQAVYVDGSGRVGIGTNSPSKKLHVAGNTIVDGTLTVTGAITPDVLHVQPDWDSDWFPASRNQTIFKDLPFTLTGIPSLIQVYVSDVPSPELGKNKIYLMNQAEYYWDGANQYTMGSFINIGSNQITLFTGQSRLFATYTAGDSNDNQVWDSGYLRVKLWK